MRSQLYKEHNAFFSLAITMVMAALAEPAFANNQKVITLPVAGKRPAYEFVGTGILSSIFCMTCQAEIQVRFELNVRDANGAVLFKNSYKAGNFSKYKNLGTEEVNMFKRLF